MTLSRQTSRNLQYFVAYTYGKTRGTLGDEYSTIDPYDPTRTYGVTAQDRTHVLNISWNAFLPDGARGAMDNSIGRGLLNGWQISGISSLASGIPYRLGFSGAAASSSVAAGYFGTADVVGPALAGGNGLAPVYTCDPTLGGKDAGEKILDINCIGVPAFGENGDLTPPYNLRQPTRSNHDLTLFKNFTIRGEQKIQFRVGFFNLFNQAFATTAIDGNDINLVLDTTCNVTRDGVPNGIGGTSGWRLRSDRRVRVHAADHLELRQDQPEARPPRGRVRAEVLLLGTADHTDHADRSDPTVAHRSVRICTKSTGARAGRLSPRSCYQAVYSGDPSRHCQWSAHRRSPFRSFSQPHS